jgi:hypothetical protein
MKDKLTGEHIPVERIGRKFYLKVVAAVGASSASDAAMVDPIAVPDELEHAMPEEPKVKDTFKSVDARASRGPPGLWPGSSVQDMRDELRRLDAPIWGTKDVLWDRAIEYYKRAEGEQALRRELEADVERRVEEQGEEPARSLPLPPAPSEAEVRAHQITHIPAKPWCQECVMGKAVQRGHRVILDREELAGAPVIAMDYALLLSDGSLANPTASVETLDASSPSNTWATILVFAHAGTGFVGACAVEKKGAIGVPSEPAYVKTCVREFMSLIYVLTFGRRARHHRVGKRRT